MKLSWFAHFKFRIWNGIIFWVLWTGLYSFFFFFFFFSFTKVCHINGWSGTTRTIRELGRHRKDCQCSIKAAPTLTCLFPIIPINHSSATTSLKLNTSSVIMHATTSSINISGPCVDYNNGPQCCHCGVRGGSHAQYCPFGDNAGK